MGWTRLFARDPLPTPDGLDLLIVLGGSMSLEMTRDGARAASR